MTVITYHSNHVDHEHGHCDVCVVMAMAYFEIAENGRIQIKQFQFVDRAIIILSRNKMFMPYLKNMSSLQY